VSLRRSDQLFIVRTWLESPGDTRTMRGRIDHAASGRRRYFANFGELCDFVSILQTFPVPDEQAPEGQGTDDDPDAVDGQETVAG
jgi:hypothetical protein